MSVESYVISALVEEGSPKKAFSEGVNESDFEIYDEEFRWIVDRAEKRKPVTPRTFKDAFPDFDFIIPRETLPDLLDELKQERAFVSISSAIEEVIVDLTAENSLRKAEELREILGDVLRTHAAHSDVLIKAGWRDHLKRVRDLQILRENGEIAGIPTGILHFDQYWGGLQGEASYLILGRPGDAKSFTLAKFTTEAAWQGYRVGFFSPEMTEHQHQCRFHTLLSAKSEIQQECNLKGAFPNRALKDGFGFNLKTYKRFLEYLDNSMKGEICLFTRKYRRERMTTSYIESRVEELGLDLVIVDPLYKLKAPRHRGTKWEELSELTDNLTNIAHAFNIPVIMSNQATRALVGSRGDPPGRDTSFGSDAPVQEADVVFGVRHHSDERIMKVACSKNRHGEPFKFTMKFLPNKGVMEDVTPLYGEYKNGYDPEIAEELRVAMREENEND